MRLPPATRTQKYTKTESGQYKSSYLCGETGYRRGDSPVVARAGHKIKALSACILET